MAPSGLRVLPSRTERTIEMAQQTYDIRPLKTAPSPVAAFCNRHYAVLAAVVLGIAAFNLLFRLGSEAVTEWDE